MNLNERGSQRYNKPGLLFPSGQLRGVTSQLVKSAECDIATVTVGNDELSSLRLVSVFSG